MDRNLNRIKNEVYHKCSLVVSDFEKEIEGVEYCACNFTLNGRFVKSRNAKITPTKIGKFVTFWKRVNGGIIEPFSEVDEIDFFVVTTLSESNLGQFVFPKSILIEKGIISAKDKEGKRAFRVYPPWGLVGSKQAENTQNWQINYFFEVNGSINFEKVALLFKKEQ
jgi:hypothetical protein